MFAEVAFEVGVLAPSGARRSPNVVIDIGTDDAVVGMAEPVEQPLAGAGTKSSPCPL